MENNYALALWKSVENGMEAKKAVHSLLESLKTSGRTTLMPRILRAFERLAEREAKQSRERIFVAREKDGAHAKHAAGSQHAQVHVDETLIGGWRLEAGETLVDASWKKYLLEMYNRAVA